MGQANMGTADLKAKFKSRRHEINVSTYQMCVLLLFNTEDTLSYSQISDTTAIPVGDLKRALQSLACAKFKILRKDPVGREVEDGDSFSFNEDFSAKQLRFKVGTVSAQKENETEKQETRQKVDGPQAADRGGHCAHHEVAQGDGAQCAHRRGDDTADVALLASPECDQEADRVTDRARLSGAGQGQLAKVHVSGVIRADACCTVFGLFGS